MTYYHFVIIMTCLFNDGTIEISKIQQKVQSRFWNTLCEFKIKYFVTTCTRFLLNHDVMTQVVERLVSLFT